MKRFSYPRKVNRTTCHTAGAGLERREVCAMLDGGGGDRDRACGWVWVGELVLLLRLPPKRKAKETINFPPASHLRKTAKPKTEPPSFFESHKQNLPCYSGEMSLLQGKGDLGTTENGFFGHNIFIHPSHTHTHSQSTRESERVRESSREFERVRESSREFERVRESSREFERVREREFEKLFEV
jgi:hypothetical protein